MKLKDYFEAQGHGSTARLAKAVGAFPSDVSFWAAGKKLIPSAMCAAIEKYSLGAVTVEELLPDAPWTRVRDRKWPHPEGRPLLDVYTAAAAKVEASHG